MKVRPIIFNSDMVDAILHRNKTQTRRVVTRLLKVGPITEFSISPMQGETYRVQYDYRFRDNRQHINDARAEYVLACCPYGQPGDQLWVREAWMIDDQQIVYKADNQYGDGCEWQPAMFMPRQASRITLEIKYVSIAPLQHMSDSDCRAEGIDAVDYPEFSYIALWDSLNAKRGYSWLSNPLVWVIQFKVVQNAA